MYAEKSNTGINIMDLNSHQLLTIRDCLDLGLKQPHVDDKLRTVISTMIREIDSGCRRENDNYKDKAR